MILYLCADKGGWIMFAPIVLFVYNRPKNTKNVLDSLSKCKFAKKSDLFIFSDAAKNSKSESNVIEVRKIINDKCWNKLFNSIKIVENENNKGLAKSVISGVTKIINIYSKVIVIEDDNKVSVDFLDYMNRGLEFYENNKCIGMIGGYSAPIKFPKDYKFDVYKMGRGSSYAWATWKDRWDKVDWEVKDYTVFKKNKKLRHEFDYYGNDRSTMLDNQMKGKIDSWAIRFGYSMFKHNMFAILPVVTRVENVGFDGSGVHNVAGESKFINHIPKEIKPANFVNVEVDERIRKEYIKKFNPSLKTKIKRKLKSVLNIKTL